MSDKLRHKCSAIPRFVAFWLANHGVSVGASLLVCGLLTSCASSPKNSSNGLVGLLPGLSRSEIDLGKEPPPGDLTDSGADLRAIPLAVNRQVLKWIDYFQGQGRPHMERYLARSSRYMPIMKQILREEGLPEDLIYIALIESGFSASAHSSANAVGYWQFIRGTGRRYGMKIDSYIDERRDFVRSTRAAAAYFKDLYAMFNSWYLAIASYNVGENRVKNLTIKYRTRDFWQLARENKLPDETINYVPKFIAARLIAKSPAQYGFSDIDYMPALEFSEVEFPVSVDLKKLAKGMNLDYDDLRDLNPAYKRGVAFAKQVPLKLRVPKGSENQALAAVGLAAPDTNPRVYASDEDYSYYRVRRGDTLSSIAKKFGTSTRRLRSMNGLSKGVRLATGRRLRVPESVAGLAGRDRETPRANRANSEPSSEPKSEPKVEASGSGSPDLGMSTSPARLPSAATKFVAQKFDKKSKSAVRAQRIHVVRKGDTLIEIARRYGVSLSDLTRHNRLSRRARIVVGARLTIP